MAATGPKHSSPGAYELLDTDTPRAVAIDEAVELAKRFGSAQSPQFCHGILEWLGRRREADRRRAAEAGASGQ